MLSYDLCVLCVLCINYVLPFNYKSYFKEFPARNFQQIYFSIFPKFFSILVQ